MEVQLNPHIGAGPFRLGVPWAEAVATARAVGDANVSETEVPGPKKASVTMPQFSIVLVSDEGEVLNGIEINRFRDENADVRVLLNGVDVFRTPSEELMETLQEWGHRLEEEYALEVPDLALIFANESSYEFPVDEEGDPLYFDYVLVADKNHPAFA